jgi:hypothetical protein
MDMQPGMRGDVPLLFAACMLVLAGCINIMEWVIALANPSFYPPNATYVVSDARTWGWLQLFVGLVQFIAFLAIITARPWGRWLGIGIAMLSVLAQFFFVNAAPWWTLVVIGSDIIIMYALTRYGVQPFQQARESADNTGDIGAVPR